MNLQIDAKNGCLIKTSCAIMQVMDKLTNAQINGMEPAVLAFVGDAVFLLYVRERETYAHTCKTGELTRRTNRLVKAQTQAEMLNFISDRLTEDEREVVRRARNAHTAKKAKNAGLSDYRRATGFEALIGYLYLQGKSVRLAELEEACFDYAEAAKEKE